MALRFRLRSFGTLTLTDLHGEALFTNHRKRLAFLAVLAADANGGVARERLFALFWPESDGERARNALNQLVFAVRRDLGEDVLVTDALTVRLDPGTVESDVRAFRDALARDQRRTAIALYDGAFLDGVYLRDAADFERWTEEQRHVLRVEYVRALEIEIDGALRDDAADARETVRHGRLLVAQDALSTAHALRLIRALVSAGDTVAALRHATTHATHMQAELGMPPGRAFDEAVAQITASEPRRTRSVPEAFTPQVSTDVGSVGVASVVATHDVELPAATNNARPARHAIARRWPFVGTAVLALVVAWFFTARRSPAIAEGGPRVVVASFINRTGDSTLDYLGDVAADDITQALSRSEIVQVVYAPTAYEWSRRLARGRFATDVERVTYLSSHAKAGTVVDGSYYLAHDTLLIRASVMDGASARVLRTISVAAARRDPRQAVQALRERAIGALATLFDPRLASLSGVSSPPPQMDAYRGYIDAQELFRQGQRPKLVMQRFMAAAQADSSFMLPVIWATWLAGLSGQKTVRDSLLTVLEGHRAQLAPVDRLALDFLTIANDLRVPSAMRLATVHRLVALAPASNWAWIEAGALYSAGMPQEALALLERIEPEEGWAGAWSPYWANLARVQHTLGLYEQELRSADRSRVLGERAGVQRGLGARIEALIALGRTDSALALAPRRATPLGYDIDFLDMVVSELHAHGQQALGDSLGAIALAWYRAEYRKARPAAEEFQFRQAYLAAAFEMEALSDLELLASALLADRAFPDPDGSREWSQMYGHAARAAVAGARGDRAAVLSEIAAMPDVRLIERFMRWDAERLKAVAAGALRDTALTIQYLASMETQGAQGPPEARYVASHAPQLRWIAADPRLRLPYVGAADWAAQPVVSGRR